MKKASPQVAVAMAPMIAKRALLIRDSTPSRLATARVRSVCERASDTARSEGIA
jgi:hypothetical protein